MSIVDDINGEIRRKRYEHHATAPRLAPITPDVDTNDVNAFVWPRSQQTPLPTKLVMSYEVFDELRASDAYYLLDFLRKQYMGLPYEIVAPDEIAAPGWRVE